MSDFIATRSFLYVAGNIIDPTQNTTNELGIYNPHNAAFNDASGHKHTGTTGDAPRIPSANIDETATELAAGATPYTVLGTDRTILCDTATVAFTVVIPDPYLIATFSKVLTIADATGNAGTNNITITINGYGVDILTGVTQSVYIVEDWGSITIARMASGFWKII